MRHAAIDDEEWLSAQVFTHLEILMKTEAVRCPIIPDVPLRAPVDGSTNRFLPAISQAHSVAFDPTTARETHKRRFEPIQHAHQARTKSVMLPSILRKQGDHIEAQGS